MFLAQEGRSESVINLVPLTVRPSLFFPPREYRLPSFGSGRNAGLVEKVKKKLHHILSRAKGEYLSDQSQTRQAQQVTTFICIHQLNEDICQRSHAENNSMIRTQPRVWGPEELDL